ANEPAGFKDLASPPCRTDPQSALAHRRKHHIAGRRGQTSCQGGVRLLEAFQRILNLRREVSTLIGEGGTHQDHKRGEPCKGTSHETGVSLQVSQPRNGKSDRVS